MELHEHCRMCINILKCQKKVTKSQSQCDIIHCQKKCGATFHACKADEHKLLCYKEKVKCINSEHGCPVILERRDRGNHLQVCPASVVHCSMTYDHWPIPLVDNAPPANFDAKKVDHRILNESEQPAEGDSSLHVSTFSDVSVSFWNSCKLWKTFKPFTLNPTEPYTFACAKDFQRLEFEWHFRNTHSDLQICLYDWVDQWCPLAQYGCKFSRQRFQPSLQANRNFQTKVSSKVVFSKQMQAFGMTENNGEISERNSVGGTQNWLIQLPDEILLVIANYLDGFSLNNLSMASPRFHSICQALLTQKGIVLPQWKKKGSSWQIDSYEWKFSSACAPVYRWFVTDSPPMSMHMQQCPYFSPYLRIKDDAFKQGEEDQALKNVIKEYITKYYRNHN